MGLIDNKEKTLQEALKNALPSAERVDILTAYFYFSGFSALADELKVPYTTQVRIVDQLTEAGLIARKADNSGYEAYY